VAAIRGTAAPVHHHAVPADLPVQFLAVPHASEPGEGRRRGEGETRRRGGAATLAARSSAVKGAGLESDLAETRPPDSLPSELRPLLPHQGLVNYLEARAV